MKSDVIAEVLRHKLALALMYAAVVLFSLALERDATLLLAVA